MLGVFANSSEISAALIPYDSLDSVALERSYYRVVAGCQNLLIRSAYSSVKL